MTRRPLAEAQAAAESLVELLATGCLRIEIAGSIRRKADDCKDIEAVAVPRFATDLLGGCADDLLNVTIGGADRRGHMACRDTHTGEEVKRYKMDDRRFYPLLLLGHGAPWPVDLFVVRPPAQWGAIFAIRTGPADYSARLVSAVRLTRGYRCDQGRLVSTDTGEPLDTPEERDFIEACGFAYLPPEFRR